MSDGGTEATTKHRSPAYPIFGLRIAVAKAHLFHVAQKRNSVHVDVATETLGYKIRSGSGLRAIAALISFGLMEELGAGENRKVKLTPLAIKILLMPEDDSDRAKAIMEAAQKPKIYEEMLKHWPNGLPSDAAISKHLTFEKNFNPEVVHLLIRSFKDTYVYANMAGRDMVSAADVDMSDISNGLPDEDDSSEDDLFSLPPAADLGRTGVGAPKVAPQPGNRVHTIPITGGRMALLNIPTDISEDDFKFVQTYLRLMKDAIITGKVSASDQDSEPD